MANEVLTVGAFSTGRGEERYGVNEFSAQGRPCRLPMWLTDGARTARGSACQKVIRLLHTRKITSSRFIARSQAPTGHLAMDDPPARLIPDCALLERTFMC